MRGMNMRLLLPSLAVFAAFVPCSLEISAQSTSEVPAGQSQPTEAATAIQAPPTPEEIGDALMTHQRYQAASAAYKKAPSNSALVMNKMGIAYQMMFNFQDALRCYKASLKISPANAHVYNNLGTVYDGLREYRNAERMYRKALELEPGAPVILKNLGSDQLAQHKYKEGWESYKAALALDPTVFKEGAAKLRIAKPGTLEERGAMNFYMAKGCLRAGMTGRAIEYLRMAINEGFTNANKIAADKDFATLRGIPAFEQLLASQRNP